MTIRSDSYSSTSEVKAYTMHLLDGQTAFNSTTRPTGTQLEKFIDRASGLLNVALSGEGLAVPITNSTAKLACDDWVVSHAAAYVELTQRGAGYDGTENTRPGSFLKLHKDANEFAEDNALAFQRLGVGISTRMSAGLQFTGLDAEDERADPDDDDLMQPIFKRRKWDND